MGRVSIFFLVLINVINSLLSSSDTFHVDEKRKFVPNASKKSADGIHNTHNVQVTR